MADYLFKGQVTVRPAPVLGDSLVTFTIKKEPEETVTFFAIRSGTEDHPLIRETLIVSKMSRSVQCTFTVWKHAMQIVQVECKSIELDPPMTTIFVIVGGKVYNLTDQEWIDLKGVETLLSPPSFPSTIEEKKGPVS